MLPVNCDEMPNAAFDIGRSAVHVGVLPAVHVGVLPAASDTTFSNHSTSVQGEHIMMVVSLRICSYS